MIKIDNRLIEDTIKIKISSSLSFDILGLANSNQKNTLTFLDQEKFSSEVIRNPNIAGVITTKELSSLLQGRNDLVILTSEDPRYDFYSLQNYITDKSFEENQVPTKIGKNCKIHPTAFVSEINVVLGNNVTIEPNATILADVEIGDNTIIRAGAVIGAEGFEHKRTSKGILSVKHDGKVSIGSNVDIGANCTIAKGFGYRHTIIGDDTKLDNLVHVAHCVQIGKRCLLIASCMIAGSVSIEDDVWVGPNASVSSQVKLGLGSFVTIGAVVTRNVRAAQMVTGNFALPHNQFLSILKKNLSDS